MKDKFLQIFNKLKQKLNKTPQDRTQETDLNLEEDKTTEINFTDSKLPLKDKINEYLVKSRDKVRKYKMQTLEARSSEDQGPFQKVLLHLQKVNWVKIPQELLDQNNYNRIHRTFQVLTAVIITAMLGKLLGLGFKGKSDFAHLNRTIPLSIESKSTITKEELNRIRVAKLFKTDKVELKKDDKSKGPKKPEIAFCSEANRKSALPIKLINTVVLQDSVKSIASVQVRSSSKLTELREGEKIDNLAKIDRIERLRLVVKNLKNGNCEAIENSKALKETRTSMKVLSKTESNAFKKSLKEISGIKNEGNKFTIKKSFLQSKMADISDLLTQARAIQIKNPDGTMSYKIVDIQPDGIFAYLGVQDNDIITHIDGEPITDLNQVMTLFGTITSLSKLNLTFKRGGSEVKQDYSIE